MRHWSEEKTRSHRMLHAKRLLSGIPHTWRGAWTPKRRRSRCAKRENFGDGTRSRSRKLVAEARRKGVIGVEDAASLLEVPNIRQKGSRLGNWLTREQAKELLTVPDRP